MLVAIKKYKFYITKTKFYRFIIKLKKLSMDLLGIKASGHYLGQVEASCLHIRQVAVTYRRGTSVVRNLKFLTPFSRFLTIKLFTHHCNLLK